jgi:hypothetical protein
MAKKSEFYVRPNGKHGEVELAEAELNKKNNIEGILVALRYLSLEAEGAGLTELANTLEEAALKWDRSTTKILSNSRSFNKSRAGSVKAASHKTG